MDMNTIPKNWVYSKISNICKTTSGGTPSRKKPEYFTGKIPWLKSGELLDNRIIVSEESITEDGLNSSSTKIIPSGTLLMALYGATVGKLGILDFNSAINQAICALFLPSGVHREYIFYFLRKERNNLLNARVGGAQPNISQQIVNNIEVPLPPLNEQKRIVAKIEELFSSLDAGVESLKRLKAQVKKYRQSVLKSAFEGNLTKEWREEQMKDYSEENNTNSFITCLSLNRYSYEDYNFPAIPKTWKYRKIKEFSLEIRYGTSKKCHSEKTGVPVLRIPNIINNSIDSSNLKYSKLKGNEYETLKLISGDILVIRSNGSPSLVGRSAVIKKMEEGYTYAGYLIRVRVDKKEISPVFFNYCLSSYTSRLQIEIPLRSTSGVHNINSDEIKSIIMPLPPLPEQHQIVSEIERHFSIADAVDKIIDESLNKAEKLRQSILKKAFEGKLVPQDPNDEPASVLLEKIMAEKAEREAEAGDNGVKKKTASRKKKTEVK